MAVPRTDLEAAARDPRVFAREFDPLVNVHLRAPLYLGMRLGLAMKKNGWGRIVNLTDRVTVKGQAYRGWGVYLATKYGLMGVTRVLAEKLRPEVTVNSVAPGVVLPPESVSEAEAREVLARIPLQRPAGPEVIAEDVLHLVRSGAKMHAE